MADATITQMLLSGAAGATIAAALNHLVRRYEAVRDKRVQESRTAYVFLTHIAAALASADVVVKVAKSYKPAIDLMVAAIRTESRLADLDAAQVIAAACYQLFKPGGEIDDGFRKTVRVAIAMLIAAAEESSFKVTPEMQSRLPEKAIVEYTMFLEASAALKHTLTGLRQFLDGEVDIGPDHLHTAWLNGKQLYDTCESLFGTLKTYGNISDREAEAIRERYRVPHMHRLSAAFAAKPKLKAIVETLKTRDGQPKPGGRS